MITRSNVLGCVLLLLGACQAQTLPAPGAAQDRPESYGKVRISQLNGARAGLPVPKDGEPGGELTGTGPNVGPLRLKTSEQVKVYKRAAAAVVIVFSLQVGPSGPKLIGSGSGFIVSKDGLIVTNNHVVERADLVTIVLKDKANHPSKIDDEYQEKFGRVATVLARSAEKDLALLKILEPPADLVFLEPSAGEDVTPALDVLAIGHPKDMMFKDDESPLSLWDVAPGAIRNVQEKKGYRMLIRHTAPINSGNSGGPLLNMDGNYIGVNTMKPLEAGFDGVFWSIGVPDILDFVAKHDSLVKQDFGMPSGVQQCSAARWSTVNLGYLPAGTSASVSFTVRSAEPGSALILGYERAALVLKRYRNGWVRFAANQPDTAEPIALDHSKPHTLLFRRGDKNELSLLLDGAPVLENAPATPARGWAYVMAGNVDVDFSRK